MRPQQILARDVHILTFDVDLIRCRHVFIEDLLRYPDKTWMGDPRTVVPSLHLTQLVLPNLFKSALICSLIVLDWYLSRHATHRVNLAFVAGMDEQIDVSFQEG